MVTIIGRGVVQFPYKYNSCDKEFFINGSENASEGDPAVTGRVMDFHETKLFGTVCYLEHVKYTQFSH